MRGFTGLRLALALAGVGLAAAPAAAAAQAAPACKPLPPAKIGLQLYSVRAAIRPPPATPPAPGTPPAPVDPAKLEAAFGALHAIGWRNVENFGGAWGLGDAAYKALADKHGLKMVAAHEGLDDAGWTAVLDRAVALGQTYVGSGGYGQPGLDTLEHVLQTAAHLDVLGRQAAQRGLKFYVHNHQVEFKNVFPYDLDGDGRPEQASAWEIVAARTNPAYVSFEIDIHWARVAMGLDNLDGLLKFLERHRSRVVLLHIKDTTPDGKYTDLGRGTTDWARVVAAAGPQVAYYLWEHDQPAQPLESARIGFDYMTCAGR